MHVLPEGGLSCFWVVRRLLFIFDDDIRQNNKRLQKTQKVIILLVLLVEVIKSYTLTHTHTRSHKVHRMLQQSTKWSPLYNGYLGWTRLLFHIYNGIHNLHVVDRRYMWRATLRHALKLLLTTALLYFIYIKYLRSVFIIQKEQQSPAASFIDERIISQIAHFLHLKNKRTIRISSFKRYDWMILF